MICKNCSEEVEEALNQYGLCADCAEEAEMAQEMPESSDTEDKTPES